MDPQEVVEVFRRNVTEHYFDLKGRVSRKEFWYFILACFVVYLGAAVVDAVIHLGLLTAVAGLALLLPTAGIGARRLQDIGRNGSLVWLWVVLGGLIQVIALLTALSGPFGAVAFLSFYFTIGWLINLAALVVAVVLIYFWCQPGVKGANEYGPDPLGTTTPAPA
ncbi:MAG: DUF805 domain-containing protein [Alphaproteobacteria bacterium]|nr:DUF805 domain-containing protein [Alphaproteobacteria bacterium]